MGDERVEIVLDEQYDKSFKHFMYNVSEDFLEKKMKYYDKIRI